jgi:tetratricopeptide (TPR) repeat protein
MKSHQFPISLLAVACYTFSPAIFAAPSNAAPKQTSQKVQKGDLKLNQQIAEIVRAEAELLKSGKVDRVGLLKLYQSAVENTLVASGFQAVPSAETKGLFQSFSNKYPSSGIISSLFAASLISVGQNSRAATIFQQAIKTSPQHVLLYEQSASLQASQGKNTAAAAILESGIAAAPYNLEFYLDLAGLQPGRFTVALAQFDRALAALPDDPTVYEAFGGLFVGDNSYANGDLKKDAIAIPNLHRFI